MEMYFIKMVYDLYYGIDKKFYSNFCYLQV